MRKMVLTAGALVGAMLFSGGAALAHHSYPNATYTGTLANGGTIEFYVSNSVSVESYVIRGYPNSCSPEDTDYSSGIAEIRIVDHAFAQTQGPGQLNGSFPAFGQAQGSFVRRYAGGCQTEPIAWTATTTAPAPPQCNDGADNDGDGKIDSGQIGVEDPTTDPGCTGEADNDETDPVEELDCPGDPGCPDPEANRKPRASALDVFDREVHFRLSKDATVRFTLDRRKGDRWIRLGTFKRKGQAGANDFKLPRKVGGRRVRAGRYRLFAVPKDSDGRKGKRISRRFEIFRGS
jgi:hypothetical protein